VCVSDSVCVCVCERGCVCDCACALNIPSRTNIHQYFCPYSNKEELPICEPKKWMEGKDIIGSPHNRVSKVSIR
jgi:hypothetical protein